MSFLSGWKFAVTRPLTQSDDLITKIQNLGGIAIAYPLIEILLQTDHPDFLEGISQPVDFLFFTSHNGVRAYLEGLHQLGMPIDHSLPVYCVGNSTANFAKQAGLHIKGVPDVFAAQNIPSLLESFAKHAGRGLIVRGNLAETSLVKRLQEMDITATEVIGYQTLVTSHAEVLWKEVMSHQVDVVTFFSGSAVRAFFDNAPLAAKFESAIAVLGPQTAKVVEQYGYSSQITPSSASTDELVNELVHYARNHIKSPLQSGNGGL